MKINGIVEHTGSLGKGEVVSSILPGSTIYSIITIIYGLQWLSVCDRPTTT
jgi:hypothetical protein